MAVKVKGKGHNEGETCVAAERVSFRFGDREVLREVCFRMGKDELVFLTGENGAGKTTLARLLVGLEKPDTGKIVCEDACFRMMVPQDFVVWPHLSVARNLKLGRRSRYSKAALEEIVSAFELRELLRVRAGRLSFGQQHRVAVARAFAQSPDFLVLDEPLANTDADMKPRLIQAIWDLCISREIGLLWITHSAEEIIDGARTLRLDDRKLWEGSSLSRMV